MDISDSAPCQFDGLAVRIRQPTRRSIADRASDSSILIDWGDVFQVQGRFQNPYRINFLREARGEHSRQPDTFQTPSKTSTLLEIRAIAPDLKELRLKNHLAAEKLLRLDSEC